MAYSFISALKEPHFPHDVCAETYPPDARVPRGIWHSANLNREPAGGVATDVHRFGAQECGKFTSVITFIEEILPITDVIPSFTIFRFLFDFPEIGKEKAKSEMVSDAEFAEIG